MNARFIDTGVTKGTGSDAVNDSGEGGALLLNGHRLVQVLIAEVLHSRSQVSEEDW